MRNFRKAALAGATAVALALGSASVATAAEDPQPDTGSSNEQQGSGDDKDAGSSENEDAGSSEGEDAGSPEGEAATEPSLSSKIGKRLGAFDDEGKPNGLDGRDLFGSSKENWDNIAPWAKLLYVTTIFTSVSAIVGLIVGPAYNFFVHGPFAA
ncbi:hypothetical protein SAMN04488535_0812 [Corynebacterium mycetoides]|uniref:Or membrane protein n=1 Tax=Corynebacterium mycetoides TaxID=38302 RepID=A0A1G9MZY9_9CORY|nr:hypothetical protein [Corynebacterium mycetoides]SDL79713.1 hypothetical protein SAMN04488535_0812 [Corynebacterium mycetoides]